ADARGTAAHVHHVALDVLGREAHVVAHADRLVGQQVDAREEVRQRVLQGQGDREAAHAERGEDRRDGDAEGAEQHEATDHEDDQAHGRAEEPGDAEASARRSLAAATSESSTPATVMVTDRMIAASSTAWIWTARRGGS